MDLGVILGLAWSVGTVYCWGYASREKLRAWREMDDARSRRELLISFSLFLAALAAGMSVLIIFVLAPPGDPNAWLRRVSSGLASGAFFAAGVIAWQEARHP